MNADDREPRKSRDRARVRVFVDYWNLALSLSDRAAALGESPWWLDWKRFPFWLTEQAGELCQEPDARYFGTDFFSSYSADSRAGRRHLNWTNEVLEELPGMHVEVRRQRRRSGPVCRSCGNTVVQCPHCGESMRRMTEKGVDVALAAALIGGAAIQAYDIGVLVTSDSDLVPAVSSATRHGVIVVQAGAGRVNRDLVEACWASIDVYQGRDEIELRRR